MKNVCYIIILGFLFTSCSTIKRKLYSPTQVNNPSLRTKNDYNVSASASVPLGFDLNAGYAITNRLAVIGGLYNYKNNDYEEGYSLVSSNRSSSNLRYKHKGFHVGAGIYLPVSHNNTSTFVSFFGGYTKGDFEMNETLSEEAPVAAAPKINFYKSNIDRYFLQGSFNLYLPHIHQSFILRYNRVLYDNVITDYDNEQQFSFNLPPKVYSKWSSFLDLSFDTKIFFSKQQRIGLQVFGTMATRVNRKEYNFYINNFRAGIGLVFKSPEIKRKIKK